MENSQRVWIMYIVFSLKFLIMKELSTERHFIIWASKLNQNGYHKGIMTSKFGSKDMILWRGSSFVFTKNETLWIVSIPIWYDRPRPPERLL